MALGLLLPPIVVLMAFLISLLIIASRSAHPARWFFAVLAVEAANIAVYVARRRRYSPLVPASRRGHRPGVRPDAAEAVASGRARRDVEAWVASFDVSSSLAAAAAAPAGPPPHRGRRPARAPPSPSPAWGEGRGGFCPRAALSFLFPLAGKTAPDVKDDADASAPAPHRHCPSDLDGLGTPEALTLGDLRALICHMFLYETSVRNAERAGLGGALTELATTLAEGLPWDVDPSPSPRCGGGYRCPETGRPELPWGLGPLSSSSSSSFSRLVGGDEGGAVGPSGRERGGTAGPRRRGAPGGGGRRRGAASAEATVPKGGGDNDEKDDGGVWPGPDCGLRNFMAGGGKKRRGGERGMSVACRASPSFLPTLLPSSLRPLVVTPLPTRRLRGARPLRPTAAPPRPRRPRPRPIPPSIPCIFPRLYTPSPRSATSWRWSCFARPPAWGEEASGAWLRDGGPARPSSGAPWCARGGREGSVEEKEEGRGGGRGRGSGRGAGERGRGSPPPRTPPPSPSSICTGWASASSSTPAPF